MNPITIAVKAIRCLQENDFGPGSDEPYVLVTAIDLTTFTPNVEVTRYGPWKDVDTDEVHPTLTEEDFNFSLPGMPPPSVLFAAYSLSRRPCWYLDNKTGKVINMPEDVIMVVSMMEHDDGSPAGARAFVKAAAVASLAASINMERPQRVQKLIADIDNVLAGLTSFPDLGFFTPDDRIGSSKELKLTHAELVLASQSYTEKVLNFFGSSGAYRVRFELRQAPFFSLATNTAPAATSLHNRLYLFAKGLDNHIYVNSAADGQAPNGWTEVQGNGVTDTALAATALDNRLYLFAKGINDQRIYVNSAEAGQPFDGFGAGWSAVPDATTDVAPAAAALGNRLYLFAKGINDQQIYVNSALSRKAFDGFGLGWTAIPGINTNAAPAATTLGNRIYVFVKGLDNRIYVNSAIDGQPFDGWGNGWSVLPNATTDTAPAAATLGNRLYVFVKGINDKRIYVASAADGEPIGGWTEVQGNAVTDTALGAAALGNRLYVVAKGINNQRIYLNSAAAGQPFDGFGAGWSEV